VEAVWDKIAQTCQVHPAIYPFQKRKIGDWMETYSRAGNKQNNNGNLQASSGATYGKSAPKEFLTKRELLPRGCGTYQRGNHQLQWGHPGTVGASDCFLLFAVFFAVLGGGVTELFFNESNIAVVHIPFRPCNF
jgi:hypothetical protein